LNLSRRGAPDLLGGGVPEAPPGAKGITAGDAARRTPQGARTALDWQSFRSLRECRSRVARAARPPHGALLLRGRRRNLGALVAGGSVSHSSNAVELCLAR
jgi:hypothetical protein